MNNSSSPDAPARVQSIERAFALLEALADAGGEAGLSALAEATGLAGPTAHRLMQTLVSLGYASRLPSRRYSLGPALIRIGDEAVRLLSRWARPALLQLEQTVHETANLAVLDGEMAVYLAQVPSRHQMRMFTEVGRRVYLHSTGVGKALLAQLSDDEARALVRRAGMPKFTDSTFVDEDELVDELRSIRSRGYALDEGEQERGVRCVAIAVPGARLPAAVSISGPDARVTRASARRAIPALREAAGNLRTAMRTRF